MKSRKVLLVADVKDWAYDFIARSIYTNFRKYEAEIVYFKDLIEKRERVDATDYDVIFAFFWYDMFCRGYLIDNLDLDKVCVGVHSHNSWLKRGISIEEVDNILSNFPATGFISKKLMDKFPMVKGSFLTPTGYNPRYFSPSPLPPFLGKLRVCWAGDPDQSHHGGIKGFYDFIQPVVEEFEEIELVTTTKSDPIKYSMMGNFYSSGHIYVNMSSNEGSPMPVLESMACGRPVISTNVGIVPEILDEDSGWIINRTKNGLRNSLKSALDNLDGLQEMGIRAYKNVEERVGDWSAMHYEKMFDYVYNQSRNSQSSNFQQ